ncbi:MAG: sulfur carrier protein ThiS [Lachnospiraceae bacterium]|nr:sulfur carrier protein ThiS [Lachnospiraceae bacterium]
MVKINGLLVDANGKILKDYLIENGHDIRKIAVECNEDIVPKSQYETFIIHSGDVLEIVSLVGGG